MLLKNICYLHILPEISREIRWSQYKTSDWRGWEGVVRYLNCVLCKHQGDVFCFVKALEFLDEIYKLNFVHKIWHHLPVGMHYLTKQWCRAKFKQFSHLTLSLKTEVQQKFILMALKSLPTSPLAKTHIVCTFTDFF